MAHSSRRSLTNEELEDAERLRAVVRSAKDTFRLTQSEIGLLCGYSGQQAVHAYISASIPINLDAALRFSKALSVPIDEISPRLAARATELFLATNAGKSALAESESLQRGLHKGCNSADNAFSMAIAELTTVAKDDPEAANRIARSILAALGKL